MDFVRAQTPEDAAPDPGPDAAGAGVTVFAPKRQLDGSAAPTAPRGTGLIGRLIQKAEERRLGRWVVPAAGCVQTMEPTPPSIHGTTPSPSAPLSSTYHQAAPGPRRLAVQPAPRGAAAVT
jgi:hypothetical protein